MPRIPRHPNKEIRKAIQYAIDKGWRLKKSGPRAHAWGRLLCTSGEQGGCIIPIYSTPSNPQNHARNIRRRLDRCPHINP